MAPPRHSPRGSDLRYLAAVLREHRPRPTPHQLDEVKRRVLARSERRVVTRRRERPLASRWTGWRARLLLASAFALALSVNAFGVPNLSRVVSSATEVGGRQDAAIEQYLAEDTASKPQCPTCSTAGGGPGTASPALGAAGSRIRKPHIGGPRIQRVLRHRGVILFVRSDFAGRLVASGRIALPNGAARSMRLMSASRRVVAGQRVKVKLGLRKKGLRALRRALTRKRRVTAAVRAVVTSPDGQRTASGGKIKLRR